MIHIVQCMYIINIIQCIYIYIYIIQHIYIYFNIYIIVYNSKCIYIYITQYLIYIYIYTPLTGWSILQTLRFSARFQPSFLGSSGGSAWDTHLFVSAGRQTTRTWTWFLSIALLVRGWAPEMFVPKKIPIFFQWEFQDPKMEVLYHIRPNFVGIASYIALT
jgi:hypothetical protein